MAGPVRIHQVRALICPICPKPLEKKQKSNAEYFTCSSHGVFASLRFFRGFKSTEHVARALVLSRRHPAAIRQRVIACPGCGARMQSTEFETNRKLEIEQCLSCDGIWFDTGELNTIPEKLDIENEFPTPRMTHLKFTPEQTPFWPTEVEPVRDLNWDPLMDLGLPVEDEEDHAPPFPAGTFIVIALCIGLSIRGFTDVGFIARNGFDPTRPLRHYGSTLFTSIFLHADWWHLLSNLYFLYICADNVEEIEGPSFLVVLFLVSALCGNMLYVYAHGIQPTIGASGGIFGVITYYALAFPKNRFRMGIINPNQLGLGLMAPSASRYFVINFSAPVFLGAYVALNCLGAYVQSQYPGWIPINYIAHAGGAAFGLIAYVAVGSTRKL
jgi:membrane associated rhomboid family serine protease